jgi:hypothetical protein
MHISNHPLTAATAPSHNDSHHACVWQPNNRPHAHPQIFYRGIGYCSLSEAALAMLLEHFIPGFDIVLGKSFQVPIGEGRSVDFCINGVVVEYHQIRFFPSRGKCGDFKSEEEFREYRRLQQRVRGNPSKRALLDRIMHQRLSANYFERRRALLDRSAYFSSAELVVATSREEFFDLIIRRFALVELPSRAQFTAMFWQMVKVVAAANEGSKKRKSA